MYGYGTESTFWLKLVLMLAIILVLLVSFNTVMRKWLKVEKKKFFSYNHVNEQHKKIDWTIRITFVVFIFLGFFINSMVDPMERKWFFESWFLLFVLIFVSETARVIMEWKYAANRNAYILTVSQLVFTAIILITLFSTNFFGWFDMN